MIVIQAPINSPQVSSLFPSPDLGDEENIIQSATLERSMDGTIYTYVRRSEELYADKRITNRKLRFEWDKFTREKMYEFIYIVRYWGHKYWRLIDWNDKHWRITLSDDPVNFEIDRRFANCYEAGTFRVDFIAARI